MRLRIFLSVAVVLGLLLLIRKIGSEGEGALSRDLQQATARLVEEIDVNQPVVVMALGTPLLGGGGVNPEELEAALRMQGIQIIEHEPIMVSEEELPRLGYGTLPEGMAAEYFQALERHADAPCIISLVGAPEAHLFGKRQKNSGQQLILINSLGIGMADVRQLLRAGIVDLAFTQSDPDASSVLEPLSVENLDSEE